MLASAKAWSTAQGNEAVDTQYVGNYAHKDAPGTRLRKEAFKAIDTYKSQLDKHKNDLPLMKAIRFPRT